MVSPALRASAARVPRPRATALVVPRGGLGKGQLRLCWWPKEKERQGTLDPEKQDPPGVLMVMERPKDAGPCSTPGADAARLSAQPGAEAGEGQD
jgi:hypothetical protein